MKHKLETFVNFPVHDFDVTHYVANKNNSQRQLYELYALTNHYGSMGSGHYTAHIKVRGKKYFWKSFSLFVWSLFNLHYISQIISSNIIFKTQSYTFLDDYTVICSF